MEFKKFNPAAGFLRDRAGRLSIGLFVVRALLHGALLPVVHRFYCTITVPFWRGDPEAYMELYELRFS